MSKRPHPSHPLHLPNRPLITRIRLLAEREGTGGDGEEGGGRGGTRAAAMTKPAIIGGGWKRFR